MKTNNPKTGLVLQGYFRIERFRRAGKDAAAQPKASPQPPSRAPRPDLLPAKMRRAAVQPKPSREPDGAWSGAPRPELLPGMGRVRGPRRVGQAQSSCCVSTTPISAGQLRVIGEGRPLEPGIRQTMERFFQTDFSAVRVHEGPAATAMGALAFTLGDELHFRPGLYDPASREGIALLGHELAHVVQQREGRVTNPYGQAIAIVQDPALEAEADRMGKAIAEQLWSGSRAGPTTIGGRRPLVAMLRTPAMRARVERGLSSSRPTHSSGLGRRLPREKAPEHIPPVVRDRLGRVSARPSRSMQRMPGPGDSWGGDNAPAAGSERTSAEIHADAMFESVFGEVARYIFNCGYADQYELVAEFGPGPRVDEYIRGHFLAYLAQALLNHVHSTCPDVSNLVLATGFVVHQGRPLLLVGINGHDDYAGFAEDLRSVLPVAICGVEIRALIDEETTQRFVESYEGKLVKEYVEYSGDFSWHAEQKIIHHANTLGAETRMTLRALGIAHLRGPCTEATAREGCNGCRMLLEDLSGIASYFIEAYYYSNPRCIDDVSLDDIAGLISGPGSLDNAGDPLPSPSLPRSPRMSLMELMSRAGQPKMKAHGSKRRT